MDPSLPFEIRPYRTGDAASMARIYYDSARQIGARAYTREQVVAWAPAVPDPARFAARAADGRVTLVAVESGDGAMIAFGDVEPDGHVDFLYCRPDAAGKGIASALLDGLLDAGRALGVPSFHVEASELARPVFEKKGFVLDHRRDFEINGVPMHNYRLTRAR